MMKNIILLLLFIQFYKLISGQYSKSRLRGMKIERDNQILQSYSSILPEREYRNIYNNVLISAETKGDTELHFRILCNPKLQSKTNQYENNILSSILFEDGSMRSSNDIIPHNIYIKLESNKILTEKVLHKLKESFPDSNIINIQSEHSKCQEYILSW